ncbi:MAG: hypothetical protein JOZ07_18120 [Solirubrobacterales bacterium]|nr:hypothetical protein [Solirubrobacterales bacterium]
MPTLPWTVCRYTPDDQAALHVLASTLPLDRYGDVPRFMRWALRIRRQLARAEGCAGYSLDAWLTHKTFFTLSAWSSAEAMNAFVNSGDHARMLTDMAGRLGQSTFVESTASASQLPLDWSAAKRRLADAAAQQG